MATRMKATNKVTLMKTTYWLNIALAILGAMDALYLYILKLTSNNRMCLGSGGCATINYSTYSEIYGIPVSLLGLLAYLVILVILLLELRQKFIAANGPLLIFTVSLAGVAFSAYLTYIAHYVIHAVCPFCIASAVIVTLIFILTIFRLVKQISS
jgi:uncharacterized membrane protein